MKKTITLVTALTISGMSLLLGACTSQSSQTFLNQGQSAYQQQDYHTAFVKLLASANRNNAKAQYAVGYMLYNGIGVQRDQATALIWLNKAAKQKEPQAQAALQKLNQKAEKQAYNLPN